MIEPDAGRADQPKDQEELESFRESFEQTEIDELKDNLRSVAQHLNAEIKKRKHIEAGLSTTIDSLKRENTRLNEQQEKDWRLPNLVLSILTCLGAVLIILLGVHLGTQFLTTFALSERSKELQAEIAQAREDRIEHESRFETLVGKFDILESDIETKFTSFQNDHRGKLAESENRIHGLESELDTVRTVVTTIHEVMPLLALADVSITAANNFEQARSMAGQAAAELSTLQNELAERQKQIPQQSELLERLKAKILDLQQIALLIVGECGLHEGDLDSARFNAEAVLGFDNTNERALLLRALVDLNASCQFGESEKVMELAANAQEHLQSLFEQNSRDQRSSRVANSNRLYLVACYLLTNEFAPALKTAESFASKQLKGVEGRYRLASSDKAALELAETIVGLCEAIEKPGSTMPEFDCKMNVGSLSIHDARLFENVVLKLATNRNQHFDDLGSANQFGLYCVKVVQALRAACRHDLPMAGSTCIGGGCGSGAHSPEEGFHSEDIAKLMAKLGLWPTDRDKFFHTNLDYAKRLNGTYQMKRLAFNYEARTRTIIVPRFRRETRTRTVLDNGEQRAEDYAVAVPYQEQVEQTYTVMIPILEELELPSDQPLPPDLYVPHGLSPAELGLQDYFVVDGMMPGAAPTPAPIPDYDLAPTPEDDVPPAPIPEDT